MMTSNSFYLNMHTFFKNTKYIFRKSMMTETDFIFIYLSIKNINSDCCALSLRRKSKRSGYMINCDKLICQEPYVFSEIKCMKCIN